MRQLILIIPFIIQMSISAQKMTSEDYYAIAFNEISDMLSGREPLSVKRAVFLNSPYNVRNNESKENKSMNHFGFSEGYQISTTQEQDAIMRGSFSEIADTKYNLIFNNCATAVQKAMINAGIPVAEPTIEPSVTPMSTPFGIIDVVNGSQMKCKIEILPSSAFQSIMKCNPEGQYLQK